MSPPMVDEATRYLELRDRFEAATGTEERRERRKELLDWLCTHLVTALRPVARRKWPRSTDPTQDASYRYSEVIDDVLHKIIEREDDPVYRDKALDEVQRYTMGAFDNLMRNHHRAKQRKGLSRLEDAWSAGSLKLRDDLLAGSAAGESLHDPRDPERVHSTLDDWDLRGGDWPRLAAVIRYRYLGGESFADIAGYWQCTEAQVRRLCARALAHLRKECLRRAARYEEEHA